VLTIAGLAFFLSGAAALILQVVWQRLLGAFSGSDVHSATIVVAAFMAGLGVGSLAGGRLADRLAPGASLKTFVLAELAIGIFGFLSADLYYGVLYTRLGHLALGPAATAALLFVSLLWPTFFMGLSLPLLTRALTSTLEGAARIAGVLYGLNTLGAAAGALTATWLLLPALGLEGGVRLAALLNLLVAALGASVARRVPVASGGSADREREPGPAAQDEAWAITYPALVALSALSGFVALSLEIVWFRILGVMLKSSSFTFGTLLAFYLSGIGLGAALISPWVHRVRQPVRWFVGLQFAIACYVAVSVTVLVEALPRADVLAWLAAHLGAYDPIDLGRLAQGQDLAPGARGLFVAL
jgi:predicted membrane-bound spermidine synthase